MGQGLTALVMTMGGQGFMVPPKHLLYAQLFHTHFTKRITAINKQPALARPKRNAINPHPTALACLSNGSAYALASPPQTRQTTAAPKPQSSHTHHAKSLGLNGIGTHDTLRTWLFEDRSVLPGRVHLELRRPALHVRSEPPEEPVVKGLLRRRIGLQEGSAEG